MARSNTAGATHTFATPCRDRRVEFSFGFPVDFRIKDIADFIPDSYWHPALETGDELRQGAWVAEATGAVDLGKWLAGSWLTLHKERPTPEHS